MAQIESYNPERSLAKGGRVEGKIMAEAGSASTVVEGGKAGQVPVDNQVASRTEAPAGVSKPPTTDRWKFLKQPLIRLSRSGSRKGEQPSQSTLASSDKTPTVTTVQTSSVIGQPESTVQKPHMTPLRYTREQLSKIPRASRWSILQALPPEEQIKAMHELGLEISGGAAPTWMNELEAALKQPSKFQETQSLYWTLMRANKRRDKIPAARRGDFDTLLAQTTKEMEDLIREAQKNPVLAYVMDYMREKYVEATQKAPPPDAESYYGGQTASKSKEDRVTEIHKLLGQDSDKVDSATGDATQGEFHYKETFWGYGEQVLMDKFGVTAAQLQKLREDYEGVASYLASKVAIAIEKEFRGERLIVGGVDQGAGDALLIEIKRRIERDAAKNERDLREKRKRATRKERLPYNSWREKFEFTWAETAEELRDTVFDWLDWFREQLPDEGEETVFESITTGRRNAISSLERALNNLGIRPENPVAKELRATIEAQVAVIGGVRLLESGKEGFEAYIKLLADFAKNFNAHHDTIYLGNAKSAIIQDFISTSEQMISLGGPDTLNKPLPGNTEDYRTKLKDAAIEYATTHELYIRERDFEEAQGTRYGWNDKIEELLLVDQRDRDRAAALPTAAAQAEAIARIDLRTGVFQSIKDRLDKEDITEEEAAVGEIEGLFGLTPDKRQDRIRKRIYAEMKRRGGRVEKRGDQITAMDRTVTPIYQALAQTLLRLNVDPADIDQAIDSRIAADPTLLPRIQQEIQDAQDRALWKWVEEYNTSRQARSLDGWFPSLWDRVRLGIDKPTKLVDRALTKEQFKAMIEEVDDPYINLTPEEVDAHLAVEFGQEILVNPELQRMSIFERQKELERRRDAISFRLKERVGEAESAFNINRLYQKFLGVDARWGGLTTRVVNEEGNVKLTTIFAEISKILKAKIDNEKAEIDAMVAAWQLGWEPNWVNEWENGFAAVHPGLTPVQMDEERAKQRIRFETIHRDNTSLQIDKRIAQWELGYIATHPGITPAQLDLAREAAKQEEITRQTRLYRRNATFASTLGLREVGVANDLPIWNYHYYGDVSQIGAFAPLVGYTDDEKDKLLPILDRPRREMEAVISFAADQYMDGRIVVTKDERAMFIEDEEGNRSDAHEESRVRPRVINEGGELALRNLFESRFMISTSGGVEVADLISRIGDLGVFDLLWEMGCQDFREFQGFIKRRDEIELRQQSFFNTRKWGDPVSWVKRIKGAEAARTMLVGGEVQGQGYQPGPLNETMDGAWLFRDEFFDVDKWLAKVKTGTVGSSQVKNKTGQDIDKYTPEGQKAFIAAMQKILEDPNNADYLGIIAKDSLVKTGGGILKYLINYMNSRRYLENRAGRAPKNWRYDNELIARAYFKELARRAPIVAKQGDLIEIDAAGKPVYAKGGEVLGGAGGEVLGGDRLAYAVQGRSELAIKIFTDILRGSSYHTLAEVDRRALDGQALRKKDAMERKRDDLLSGVMSPTHKTEYDARMLSLKQQEEQLKQAAVALGVLPLKEGDPIDAAKIKQWKDAQVNLKVAQAEHTKKTNEAVETDLTAQVAGGNLTHELLLKRMVNRRKKLLAFNTKEANLEWEIYRLINQDIDTRLHMEFVGEWPARLAV